MAIFDRCESRPLNAQSAVFVDHRGTQSAVSIWRMNNVDTYLAIEELLHGPVGRLEEAFPREPLPLLLRHYTSADTVLKILRQRALWLTSQPSPGDPLEIHHGNRVLCDVGSTVLSATSFAPLARMLHDPHESMFAQEHQMFVACFTVADDQWEQRYPNGAALVFESSMLQKRARLTIESSGLVAVSYDEARLRSDATRFFIEIATLPWAAEWTGQPDSQQLIAQHLMEVGGRSFFFKRPQWSWEREWRIVKRMAFGRPFIEKTPVEHIQLSVDAPDGGLRALVVGPRCTTMDRAAIEHELAASWPWVDLA